MAVPESTTSSRPPALLSRMPRLQKALLASPPTSRNRPSLTVAPPIWLTPVIAIVPAPSLAM